MLEHIELLRCDTLRGYEELSQPQVRFLGEDIGRCRILHDPIIVDKERSLVIDGGHRVAALKSIGCRWVPAYTIDYFSKAVSVGRWYRMATATAREVIRLLGDIPLEAPRASSKWNVVLWGLSNQFRIPATSPNGCARLIQHICDITAANGQVMTLCTSEPDTACLNGRFVITTDPVIDKNCVIDAVNSQTKFPPQVNRHKIMNRIVGIDIPLQFCITGNESPFREWVSCLILETKPAGTTVRGRFYEEQIVAGIPRCLARH